MFLLAGKPITKSCLQVSGGHHYSCNSLYKLDEALKYACDDMAVDGNCRGTMARSSAMDR